MNKTIDVISDVKEKSVSYARLPVTTDSRGEMLLDRISISTTYPLGLLRCWSYYDTEAKVIVFPKPGGDAELPTHDSLQHEQNLGHQTGNEDFSGLKPFRPGHSPAHLHWKLYARNEELLLKEFNGGGYQQLVLDWQQLTGNDTEAKLSQLCLWINIAEREGIPYQLKLSPFQSKLDHGTHHQQECLTALALFKT